LEGEREEVGQDSLVDVFRGLGAARQAAMDRSASWVGVVLIGAAGAGPDGEPRQ
jgi:hypothetical protein